MKTWALWASMGLALGGLVACSSDDGGGDGDGGGGGSDGGSSTGGTGATATGGTGTGATNTGGTGTGATNTGATGGGGPTTCADEPTQDDCFDCCDAENDAAFTEINTVFADLCICGAGAPCETDCAGICADPNAMPSAACTTCLDAVQDPNAPDQCITDTFDACVASATCSPIVDCWGSC